MGGIDGSKAGESAYRHRECETFHVFVQSGLAKQRNRALRADRSVGPAGSNGAQIFSGSGDANGCCTDGPVFTSTEGSPTGFIMGAGTSGGSTAGAGVVSVILSEGVVGESIIDVVLGVCICSCWTPVQSERAIASSGTPSAQEQRYDLWRGRVRLGMYSRPYGIGARRDVAQMRAEAPGPRQGNERAAAQGAGAAVSICSEDGARRLA